MTLAVLLKHTPAAQAYETPNHVSYGLFQHSETLA